MGDIQRAREKEKPPLIVILGPTAVGKSSLALKLAQEFGGELVSADSRQIYRGMDIGTATPTIEDQALVPHHLLDLVEPDEILTLAQYQKATYQAIAEIHARGKLPFLVGGTGLYIRAVVEGFQIPSVAPDQKLRHEITGKDDVYHLYTRLMAVDSETAGRMDPKNMRRMVRALEVYEKTGKPISSLQKSAPPPFHTLKIGLTMDRAQLYRRIDERVEKMMANGLLEEVKALLARGYSPDLPALSGLGYRELVVYLKGEMDIAEAIQSIKFNTHRLVREQYKWFRLTEPSIHWFDASKVDFYSAVKDTVSQFLK